MVEISLTFGRKLNLHLTKKKQPCTIFDAFHVSNVSSVYIT